MLLQSRAIVYGLLRSGQKIRRSQPGAPVRIFGLGSDVYLFIDHLQEIVHSQPVVHGNTPEDTGKRARFDRTVEWNDFVVLAVPLSGHTGMRALLPDRLLPQNGPRRDQLRSVNIARQLQQASTSSRTKCSRIIFGASIDSSK